MGSYDLKKLAGEPVFFERNRVFRVYLGGKLFNGMFGDKPEDNNLPEEWIASNIKALNSGSTDPKEGVSRVRGTDVYLDDLMEAEKELMLGGRENLGILVKILDSAIRLPIQAHPDKPFSRKYFNSEFGKTEAWVVLATRENARIYFGFKDEITKEQFVDAVERSENDKTAMESLLNPIEAKPGDVYLIPARAVHAIGYGCLILEIQEPTDFTIQPEAWCGDYHLNDFEKYLGLDADTAISVFDFSIYGEKAVALGRKSPRSFHKDDTLLSEELIGLGDTDCFTLNRHTLKNGVLRGLMAPAAYVVTEGEGKITMPGYSHELEKGDYFLLPAKIAGMCSAEGTLQIIECLPPEKK